MEERVRAYGSGNGSHTGASGIEVGGSEGTGESVSAVEAEQQLTRRMTCTEHGVHVSECFPKHHVVLDERVPPDQIIAVPPKVVLVLPCRHLCNRPDHSGIVVCECGKKWKMAQDNGGMTWTAQEIVT